MGYFSKFSGGAGIEFMDGRDKGNLPIGVPVRIDEFAFLANEEGEYAVFTLQGTDSKFFFGNGIITETLKQVRVDGMGEALRKVDVVFEKRTSKKGREYTAMRFASDIDETADDIPF